MKNNFTFSLSEKFINKKTCFFQKCKKFTKLPMQDLLGIFIIAVLLPVGFFFVVTFVLSFWYSMFSLEWCLRVIPLVIFAINAYLNIFQAIRVGANNNLSSLFLPSVLKSGYKFCYSCSINSPPRSHHCVVCNICIYRRDHHCSFIGSCIGHFNQRYFIGAISNLWIISLPCCVWNWFLLFWVAFPKFEWFNIWQLMFPHLAFMFGFISIFQFFSIICFVCSMIVFLFNCYLIAAQVFCFWRGQTRVEYMLDIQAYNLNNFFENVRECIGEKWPLIFISPFFDTQLSSDGLSFRTKEFANVNKNLKDY